MTLVTFNADFSVPPSKRSEAQLHYCFDDTVDLSKEDKKRVDDHAKQLEDEGQFKGKPYVDGAQDLKDRYIGPRVDSPSNSGNAKQDDKK